MYQGGVLGYPFAPDSHWGDPLESGKPKISVPTVIMTSDVAHPAPGHVVMAHGPTRSGVGWRMSRHSPELWIWGWPRQLDTREVRVNRFLGVRSWTLGAAAHYPRLRTSGLNRLGMLE